MKIFVTKDGVNLYDLFKAGVGFGLTHGNTGKRWTEAEWLAALEDSLPKEFVASLKTV